LLCYQSVFLYSCLLIEKTSIYGHTLWIQNNNNNNLYSINPARGYSVLSTKFRDGLASLGVLDALQKYPLQLKSLFVHAGKALTATDMENLFQIIHSERGSDTFQGECSFNSVYVFLYFTVERGVSLEDILVFFTGCDSIPALGFSPKPSLEFSNHSRFPVANTCENILRIPFHAVYTAFKHDMDFAIRNSPGFGRA
uniref:HECT domain-containing protein n=1 Tax=Labrus bergylta TaxID=56723 RepID=A0A3Q3FKZ8_9LABR